MFRGYLRQSTAISIKVGPFVDDTDGKTAETALTLSQADFHLSKNGGAFAQKSETTTATHDAVGYYDCLLNTTDTNTLGRLLVAVHESGALPVPHAYVVLSKVDYDIMFSGLDFAGTCQTGSASGTLVLASSASSNDDDYNNMFALITEGPGTGQYQEISDYTGSSRTCALTGTWKGELPTTASKYRILR